jgi:hypothetical protein
MRTTLAPKCTLSLLSFTLALPSFSNAGFVPIPLTPDSFNEDVIVEKNAPSPVVPVTTASMDTGADNTGYAWCERGYIVEWPAIGLPPADATVTIGPGMNYDCRFAPSYKTNNVLLIDSVLTNGTLTLTQPAPCAQLSFLVSGGNGGGAVGYKVHHQDGSTEVGTAPCHDWLDALNADYTTFGRVNVNNFTFADLNMNRPGLYLRDVELTNATSPVASVEFFYRGGASHNAIFAVSGAAAPGERFTAMRLSGYNADLVVEASATRKGFLQGVTTATPELGTVNWAHTWYEQGYYPPAPNSGLPAAGSLITNSVATDHRYLMPSDYAANNATLLDADCAAATLTPVNPSKCAALSFLGTAGNGPVTVGCQVHHADGNVETNWFVLPDWLSTAPAALAVTGFVSLDFRTVDLAKNPALFAKDITLTNTSSPVSNVVLTYVGGPASSHAVLFAVSGSAGGPAPARPALSIIPLPGGAFKILTTLAGELQSASECAGNQTVWRDEGPITTEVLLQRPPGQSARFYRVLVR